MSLSTWFDNRTLLACQALLAAIFAGVFYGVQRVYPRLRGVHSITLGFALAIPASVLIVFNEGLSTSATLIAATLFGYSAYFYFHRGVSRFMESNRTVRLSLIAVPLAFLAATYFTVVHENVLARVVINSLIIGLVRALIAIELYLDSTNRPSLRIFGSIMAIFAGLAVNRAILSLLNSSGHSFVRTDNLRTFSILADVLFICISGIFFLAMVGEELKAIVEFSAQIDPVTSTLNRKAICDKLEIELDRSCRCGQFLSVALIDIDHFKLVNDTHGHAAGDAALRAVTTAISGHLGSYDVLGRFGGDEFLLILPETTLDDATFVAQRIRATLETSSRAPGSHAPTISLGITQHEPDDTTQNLLDRADSALYEAKRSGRNRVCQRPRFGPLGELASTHNFPQTPHPRARSEEPFARIRPDRPA